MEDREKKFMKNFQNEKKVKKILKRENEKVKKIIKWENEKWKKNEKFQKEEKFQKVKKYFKIFYNAPTSIPTFYRGGHYLHF